MSYEVTLLVFGILLFLVGLVGKVKAKELEVGTSSKMARIIIAMAGLVLVVLSFNPDIIKTVISQPQEQTGADTHTDQKNLEGVYIIQQKSNHRYVDAWLNSKHDYALVTRNLQNTDTQQWILKPLGNDTYTIQQKSNGRYVDAWLDSKHDYALVTRDWQDNNTQQWIIKPFQPN